MKKILIVDDESSARKLIKEYLEVYTEFKIVGEANNGLMAVKLIDELEPDLVFLDIMMPGLDGFEVLGKLNFIPKIIFSTAYDQYAIKAFDIHAVDYLLKPYSEERFHKAISRLDFTDQSQEKFTQNLLFQKFEFPERIIVQKGNKLVTLKVSEIQYILAFGDYSKIISNHEAYLSSFGLSALLEKLNPKNFIRVHRSSVINIHAIKELNKHLKTYQITMIDDFKIRVSTGFSQNIKKLVY